MIIESSNCRLCNSPVREIIDLGSSAPANNFDNTFSIEGSNQTFPLILDFCDSCKNLQLRHCLGEDLLYSDYSYITPHSDSLLNHYNAILNYVEKKIDNLNKIDLLEIGSNTGELLKYLQPHVQSILGVDPAKNITKLANENGIETICNFFDLELAKKISKTKKNIQLVFARHMFAHNSNPKDLILGMKEVLNEEGFILIENAYAIETLLHGEFDQVYHEHMFFYSATSMNNLLKMYGLFLHDIFFSEVHGGSIVFVASVKDMGKTDNLIKQILYEETLFQDDLIFKTFVSKINEVKDFVLDKISSAQNAQQSIGAYGAPAKAFTMFSLLELDNSVIKFCVDTTPTKIGKFFPVTNIPIISEEQLKTQSYDMLLVMSWNYKKDILAKSNKVFKKGTKLIFPLPHPKEYIV